MSARTFACMASAAPGRGPLLALAVGVGALGLAACSGQEASRSVAAPEKLLCDAYAGVPRGDGVHAGMVLVRGGRFRMGSDHHYPEEAPAHEAHVGDFWMDRHDVTNAQFARFVAATGYVTLAERVPDVARHPGLPPPMRQAGSVVFMMPDGQGPGRWRYVPGANWRHPQGPGSGIEGMGNHPVVHVAYEDALAYARWLGRELPTEAQWEYAARGGLDGEPYVWGPAFLPQGQARANTWQGPFPARNEGADGHAGTSPVGCFAANGFGLYDMAGNVWQWTSSWYQPGHGGQARQPLRLVGADAMPDAHMPAGPAKVIKGGSHLCAPNHCARYRPAARQGREIDSGTSHIGFRTVISLGEPA